MTAAIHIKRPILSWLIAPQARDYIQQHGFSAEDIGIMLGASGGPKWLVLAGLDRALFSEFLPTRTAPLTTLASSIGSWRFAALAQRDSLAALERFVEAYLAQSYPAKVTIHDVSRVLDAVLSHVLGEQGIDEILTHPVYRNHIVTIRSGGLLQSDHKLALMAGLCATFLANAMGRTHLGRFCERAVFGDSRDRMIEFDDSLPTRRVALSADNLELALRASGAVPLVLAGVHDIPGAPAGVYRDGGVTDYHFDASLSVSNGLVFYPHFYSYCVPGWFDKTLKSRHHQGGAGSRGAWQNLVMVAPSAEFVASLPGGRIPDRKDFFAMDNQQRLVLWKRTVTESERLGDAFLDAVHHQRFDCPRFD